MRVTTKTNQAQCIHSAHTYPSMPGAKLRHLTITPDHRRALCPAGRGALSGIRPYARYHACSNASAPWRAQRQRTGRSSSLEGNGNSATVVQIMTGGNPGVQSAPAGEPPRRSLMLTDHDH